GDVEGVEHVDGVLTHGGDHLEKRFPHVTANYFHPIEKSGVLGFKSLKPLAQGGLGAAHPDIKQTARTGIDLIDERQEIGALLAAPPVEFVLRERGDTGEVALFESPSDHILHRTENGVPTGVEYFGGLFPRQQPGPAGEKDLIGFGIRALTKIP